MSCYAHLLNELLEKDVPWDDAIVLSTGKLTKVWDSLSELRRSVCEWRLERTVLRPALLPVETAQFTQFFRQVWRHTVKSLSSIESVQGALNIQVAYVTLLISKCLAFLWADQRVVMSLVTSPQHSARQFSDVIYLNKRLNARSKNCCAYFAHVKKHLSSTGCLARNDASHLETQKFSHLPLRTLKYRKARGLRMVNWKKMWTEVVVAYLKMIPEDFLIGRNQDSWSSCRKSDLKSAECDVKTWNFVEARCMSLDSLCEDVSDTVAWNGEVALTYSVCGGYICSKL